MNPFAKSSVNIAARLTDVPQQYCTVGCLFFNDLAFVDVVVSRQGVLLATGETSLREALVAYGPQCAVVSLLFGEPNLLNNQGAAADELQQLLPEARSDNDAELVRLYNQSAAESFLSVGRKDPIVPSNWAMLGGVVLDKGIETKRDKITKISIDRLWNLWKYGKWDCPEPAEIPVAEKFAEHYQGIFADMGWAVLPN